MDTGKNDVSVGVTDSMSSFKSQFQTLPANDLLNLLTELLRKHAETYYQVAMPGDFLQSSLKSMQHLQSFSKVNVLHELAKGLGTLLPHSSETLFPISRMPFGMLQYMVTFFNCKPGQNVRTVMMTCILCVCKIPILYPIRLATLCTIVY